jgi:hypothetical protein
MAMILQMHMVCLEYAHCLHFIKTFCHLYSLVSSLQNKFMLYELYP